MAGIDLKELEAELAKTRGTLDVWAKSKSEAAIQTRDSHFQVIHDQTVKLSDLRRRHAELGLAAQQVKHRAEREQQEATTVQKEMLSAQQEQLSMQQRVSMLREQVQLREQECAEYEEAANLDDGIRKKKINALKKALSLYSSRLGLEFKQSQEMLQLVFTHIDASQPSRQFLIGVKVQTDQQCMYEVTKCAPALECLPRLEAQLNASNDFSEFVKAVRAALRQQHSK